MAKPKLPTATAEKFDGLTLMRMRTEFIKRVRVIDLTFTEPLTLIGGDNSNGKTSYLDSMDWCLGGKSVIQMDPIHHGKQSGSMLCEFGDGLKVALAVTRTLKRLGESEFTSEVEVDIPGHVAPSRIQDFLDKLAGRMSFDPMAFDRLKDAERFEALRKLVVGFDFNANAVACKTAYDERTNVNRDQKREQSAADSIVISDEPPCERIDEDALSLEMKEAGEKNLDTEKRRANRARALEIITESRQTAATVEEQIAAAIQSAETFRDREVTRIEEQIAALQRQIESVRKECAQAIATEMESLRTKAQEATRHADELQAKLDAAEPLPEVVDMQALVIKQSDARTSNKRLDDWTTLRSRKTAYQAEADRLSQKAETLTKRVDSLDAERVKAIEDANLPVEGIGFGDGYVSLNNVPWSQAGRAERVDASTAIAMALHPKLKVILIRDGSDLGKAMRDRIRERAVKGGYRVLMEVVDDSPNTHVVIENGEVKARTEAAEGAAA